jgi:hypothetical protein
MAYSRRTAAPVRPDLAGGRMKGKYFQKGLDTSEAFLAGRKRISVVGLRKAQAGIVRRRCEAIARIDCVDADRSDVRLPQCDHVIVMTRFTDHRWTQSAYRFYPRDRVHLHSGGMSVLFKKIEALANCPRA